MELDKQVEAEIIRTVVAWENQQSGPKMSNGELRLEPRTEARQESVELGALSAALEGYRYTTATRMVEKRQQDGSYTRIGKCELADLHLGNEKVYFADGSKLSRIAESLSERNRTVSDQNNKEFIAVFERQDNGGR